MQWTSAVIRETALICYIITKWPEVNEMMLVPNQKLTDTHNLNYEFKNVLIQYV